MDARGASKIARKFTRESALEVEMPDSSRSHSIRACAAARAFDFIFLLFRGGKDVTRARKGFSGDIWPMILRCENGKRDFEGGFSSE